MRSGQSDSPRLAASGVRLFSAGVIGQNLAHRLGRHGEEVGPILPLVIRCPRQLGVGFVHQRRGFERVVGGLYLKVAAGQCPQFVVDHGISAAAAESSPRRTRSRIRVMSPEVSTPNSECA